MEAMLAAQKPKPQPVVKDDQDAFKKKLESMPMMGMMGGPPPNFKRASTRVYVEESKEDGFDDLHGFKVNRGLAHKGRAKQRGTLFDANNFKFGEDDDADEENHFK